MTLTILLTILAQAIFAPGSAVEVQTATGWVAGKIVGGDRDDGQVEYKVTIKDGNFTFDRYFTAEKVRAIANAAPAAMGPAFAMGQAVEARDWNGRWRSGAVKAVTGSADTWRYTVKFADDGSETSFYGDRVRRPTGAVYAPPATKRGGPLVLGEYNCTRWLAPGQPQPPVGTITLLAGGSYRWLNDGGSGRYTYDPASGNLRFLSGPVAAKLPKTVTYERNGDTSQIDLNFAYGVD